jgi:hypothetical protein
MSGARGKFYYSDDAGRAWTLILDRSNALAAGMSEVDDDADFLRPPSNMRPRYAAYSAGPNGAYRRIVFGSPEAYAAAPNQLVLETVKGPTLFVRGVSYPERVLRKGRSV